MNFKRWFEAWPVEGSTLKKKLKAWPRRDRFILNGKETGRLFEIKPCYIMHIRVNSLSSLVYHIMCVAINFKRWLEAWPVEGFPKKLAKK